MQSEQIQFTAIRIMALHGVVAMIYMCQIIVIKTQVATQISVSHTDILILCMVQTRQQHS
jgi:hypothetical protein